MKTTSTILFALFLFLFNASPIFAQDDNDNYFKKEITTNSINYNSSYNYSFVQSLDSLNNIKSLEKLNTKVIITDSIISFTTDNQEPTIFYRCDWLFDEYENGELYLQLGDNEHPVALKENLYGFQIEFICYDKKLIELLESNRSNEQTNGHVFIITFRTIMTQYTCEVVNQLAWYENCSSGERTLYFNAKMH